MQHQQLPAATADIKALAWSGAVLRVLDQRQLPAREVYIECDDVAQVAEAIRNMLVRGAPAIGIAAAYGVALAARQLGYSDHWEKDLAADFALLQSARPSAFNLTWALRMMRERLRRLGEGDNVPEQLLRAAISIHESDVEANLSMARLGMQLIRKHQKGRQNLMTLGNTGALATGGHGTALGVIRAAHAAGLVDQVYVNETRPWLQGSRLSAWELERAQVPALLHVDAAAAHVMKTASITWVVIGADRIAANGDVISKIGSYALAVLAMHHGLRFMVVAPSSTIDMGLEVGDDAPLEERGADELLVLGSQSIDTGVAVFNPVFDVTPADLVDVIVTEKGLIERPDATKMADLMSRRRLH